ncbi:putative ATPase [Aequitasia blattaphilus]|uniref:AAA family ATPase n=1 Tax=Aequitasia blattaphilus TaxID=2949332 RepID=A0ABT1ECC9_9FIRM|nr:AAA family ATPase [Aequitasia blattaphilus]MCP1103484.1 AAA family ATPase [Aequitasia blattaphilus]MCR8616124.1 AAA family ATPase [Aequitasia blattaphilus]
MDGLKTARELGYANNKDVKFKKINGIYIKKFRSIENKKIELGSQVTIISGKNGTMKSCMLGLIAHPFSSPNHAKDSFGNDLKTDMKDVFFLSLDKDVEPYHYNLLAETIEGEELEEPIRVYPRVKEKRFRVTVGKDNKSGMGNFLLNTSYVNLKRLYPIVETNAVKDKQEPDTGLQEFVADGYSRVIQKEEFLKPSLVIEKKWKNTFSPSEDASYDYMSISSGEDNIGHILNKMYAFVKNRASDNNCLNGILCIDEIEASLHPIAQKNFLDYILNWSKHHKVQVVLTTHSLFLIQYALMKQKEFSSKDSLVVNMISTAFVRNNNYDVIKNPTYETAYKELTFESMNSLAEAYRVNVLCEDEVAVDYLKKIVTSREILKKLDFLHDMDSDRKGTSYITYKKLIKNGEKLLENSIVVFDADVDLADLKAKKVSYLHLPSFHGMPIEKEIVKYIHDLPGDDRFFIKFKAEQASFANDFSHYGIKDYSAEAMQKDKVDKYKNWAKSDSKFKQYVNYFAKNNQDIMQKFLVEFLGEVNKKLDAKSLPLITF